VDLLKVIEMNRISKREQRAKQKALNLAKAQALSAKKKKTGRPRVKFTLEERIYFNKHKHDTHPVEVRPGKAHNAGQLFCIECQKHIQWLSRADYEFLLRELNETHTAFA
jgi:hypothetical protein